ncbi:MAG: 50S ribosomal protein L11 methyltransferase, partial [Pseudomonadota bacterium]
MSNAERRAKDQLILAPDIVPAEMRPLVEAVEGRPDYARCVAHMLSSLGDRIDASAAARLAVALRMLAMNDVPVWIMTEQLIRKAVPDWHFAILKDRRRNSVYDDALKAMVEPDMTVLEIGTGSGILAMMAARAGAKHVYTLEVEPLLAEAARANIIANGYQDRITVINKNVIDVAIGSDLPERCNLIVHEIVSNNLFSQR